jgi:pSer/pThr/pTyr-binding forkhead associated (FHA) protein
MKPNKSALIIVAAQKQYYLKQKQSLTVGRSRDNDIEIADRTVSRWHATFTWNEEFPTITDLDSTSGTYVDDCRINSAFLSGSHTITLGETSLKARFCEKINPGVVESLTASDEVTLLNERGSKDIRGYLTSNSAVHRLLVSLETSRRTGTLTIRSGLVKGEIIYGLGKIRYATCESKMGLPALHHLANLDSGSYHFSVNVNVGETDLYISATDYICRYQHLATRKRARFRESDLLNSHDVDN